MRQNDYYYYNGEIYNNNILAVMRFLKPSLFPFIRCSRVTRKSTILRALDSCQLACVARTLKSVVSDARISVTVARSAE